MQWSPIECRSVETLPMAGFRAWSTPWSESYSLRDNAFLCTMPKHVLRWRILMLRVLGPLSPELFALFSATITAGFFGEQFGGEG
jgi:hypothetical protein